MRNVLRTRILDEVKLWAVRRYGPQAEAISAEMMEIVPDPGGDADYLVHLNLPNVHNAPSVNNVRVTLDPDGTICLATGD
jgi:hypothetical protein